MIRETGAGCRTHSKATWLNSAETLQTLATRMEWLFASVASFRFGTLDIEVHDNRLLTASDDHSLTREVGIGIDLLVRHIRRHVNKVARTSLVAEFQALAPPH